MQILARTAVCAVDPALATTLAPRCIHCESPASFFLCNEQGHPLPRRAGGFCLNCAPKQQSSFKAETSKPAIDGRTRIELRLKRSILAQDVAAMAGHFADAPYSGTGPSDDEFCAAGLELKEMDAQLNEERSFIHGFDDLPESYFDAYRALNA